MKCSNRVMDPVSLIVGSSAVAGNVQNANPVDSVGLAAMAIGLLVFLYFAVAVSVSGYRRRKEIEAQVAEWKRDEEERKRRLKERLAELEST